MVIAALWSPHSLRLRIVFLTCFALIAQGMMRADLSMAIVCMAPTPSPDDAHDQSPFSNESTNKQCRPVSRNNSNMVILL